MSATATCATEVFAPHLRALDSLGPQLRVRAADEGLAILAEAGFPLADLSDRAFRIPHPVVLKLLDNALRLSGDPAFALRAGAGAKRGDFGLFDLLMLAAPTLGESMRLAVRFIPLLHDGITIGIDDERGSTVWHHGLVEGLDAPAPSNEYVTSAFLVAAQRGLGFDAPPTEVRFTHARPGHAEAYETVFHAPVRFGCDSNALVLPRIALDAPLVTSDPELLSLLLRYAERELSEIPGFQPFTRRLRELVAGALEDNCHLGEVASKLHMSETTVQRRLQAEGTTHSEVVDGVRKTRALELLADPELHIGEIATQLGFSHRPAFHRAFKRWHDVSPSDYRKRSASNAIRRFYGGTAV